MKPFAGLQSRLPVPRVRPCLQGRNFATNAGHVDPAPEPQVEARAEPEKASMDEPGPDDFVFDKVFEINADQKTIETAAGSLPISPLLDPKWRAAKTRINAKPLPDKSKLNRFQRQLYQNPFAQMLATPVRSCYVTRIRLPGAFLQSFGLVRHPETNDVWWIPEAIESEKSALSDSAEAQGSQPASTSDETAASTEAAVVDKPDKDKPAKPKSIYRYPSHVLARQDLLQAFFTKGSKYKGGHFRLASNPHVSGLASSAIWREDMDTVVLELSRRQVMYDLLYLSRLCEEQGRKYFLRVNDAKETGRFVRRWCFLWLGEGKDQISEVEVQEAPTGPEKLDNGPGQYATLDIDGVPETTRPVYNLPRLLGPDNLQRLRSGSSIFREGSLFLLRGQRGLKLSQRLWKLQGYMLDYSKF